MEAHGQLNAQENTLSEWQSRFGEVESVKAVSDLCAPLAGEIHEVNEDLEENPELVNEDPYGQGWIIGMQLEDVDAVDSLMSADAYRKYVEERSAS